MFLVGGDDDQCQKTWKAGIRNESVRNVGDQQNDHFTRWCVSVCILLYVVFTLVSGRVFF